MQRIPFTLVRPGMVLAKEIYRNEASGGPPICGKGVVLSESLIERLRSLDIQAVTVQGHPVVIEGEMTLEEQLQNLDRRFRRHAADPLTLKLKEIYRHYLTEAMGE